MNKLFAIVALSSLTLNANAESQGTLVMDKVAFQVSAKQWVSTQSALLTVNINMTLGNTDLVKAREEIMKNLTAISTGDWHLTQFDRSQDSSGLEKLFVAAQARVMQANLSDIYKNAKGVSKPGATYEINSIEFKPSLDEIQQVKAQLREHLYAQINNEIGRLNKIYTNQNYSLNRVSFYEGEPVVPMARTYEGNEMKAMAMSAAPAAGVSVSNELIMGAQVELASNRQEGPALAKP